MKKTVIAAIVAIFLIAFVPLFVLKDAELGGSDDAGSVVVEEVDSSYEMCIRDSLCSIHRMQILRKNHLFPMIHEIIKCICKNTRIIHVIFCNCVPFAQTYHHLLRFFAAFIVFMNVYLK